MSNRGLLVSTLGVLALLGVLVVTLARLEWNWLRQIENYEHLRLDASASRRVYSLKQAFEMEIDGLAACLRVPAGHRDDLAREFGARWAQWRHTARWPDLSAGAYLVAHEPSFTVERFDPALNRFTAVEPTAQLSALRLKPPRGRTAFQVDGRAPALFVEVRVVEGRGAAALTRAWLVLLLDAEVLTTRLWPDLVALFFPPLAPEQLYRGPFGPRFHRAEPNLAVVETTTGKLLYSTLPVTSLAEFGPAEGAFGLVDAGTDGEELQRVGLRPRPGQEAIPSAFGPAAADQGWFRSVWARGYYSGHWQVFFRSGTSSIADEVAAARTQSAWLGLGVLGTIFVLGLIACALAVQAQRLARDRLAFLASVSHELRTPLAALSAAGDNLADGLSSDPARLREYGRLIQDETQRLHEMVENVLHFARRRGSAPTPTLRSLEVNTLVQHAVDRARRAFDQARFEVELVLPSESPRVRGNLRALQSALANLLSNALKYGARGRWVKVSVQTHGDAVEITVADRGPGITGSERGRVFEAFFRGETARTDQAEGSGLGLAVVRDVVELHHGRVRVEADGGVGSRFILELPRETPP